MTKTEDKYKIIINGKVYILSEYQQKILEQGGLITINYYEEVLIGKHLRI